MTYSMKHSTVHFTEPWCLSVVVMWVEKYCLARVETLAKSPVIRMDTRETLPAKAAEAAASQIEPRDICALVTQRTSLTQEEMVLAQTGLCCLLLPEKRGYHVIHQASS